MANEILSKNGTQIVWADTTDFGDSPVARTVQIDLTSLAAAAARQGVKVDLGATRAARYDVTLRFEFDVAPTSGNIVSVWWAPSESGTAATANPGGVSGADAAYTGTAGDSLADSIKQLQYIGALIATSDAATVVNQQTWTFFPQCRYGSPVIWNETDQAAEGDAVEMSLIFTPVIDEVQ
jgi:hypothetical protein